MQRIDELFNILKAKRELWKQTHPNKDFPGVVDAPDRSGHQGRGREERVPDGGVRRVSRTSASWWTTSRRWLTRFRRARADVGDLRKGPRGLPAIARLREERSRRGSRWTMQAGLVAAGAVVVSLVAHTIVSRQRSGCGQAFALGEAERGAGDPGGGVGGVSPAGRAGRGRGRRRLRWGPRRPRGADGRLSHPAGSLPSSTAG